MAKRHPNSNSAKVKERRMSYITVLWLTVPTPRPGGGGRYSHTLPKRVCAAHRGRDFRTGYLLQRRFLERGIIFRTHESSSFVSSHLKLFKDRLLLKIRFNALTSKLLYSCCTLCFSVQGGRILARAASADSAILDK